MSLTRNDSDTAQCVRVLRGFYVHILRKLRPPQHPADECVTMLHCQDLLACRQSPNNNVRNRERVPDNFDHGSKKFGRHQAPANVAGFAYGCSALFVERTFTVSSPMQLRCLLPRRNSSFPMIAAEAANSSSSVSKAGTSG